MMGRLLPDRVVLHDVLDVEAFVRATIRKVNLRMTTEEHDELVAEGVAIMVKLAQRYEPRRAGYDRDGTFAGYAAKYLPLRLSEAWHRMHPGHSFVTDPQTGVRGWVYDDVPVSLDQVQAEQGDNVTALHTSDRPESDLAADLRPLLEAQAQREIDLTIKVGELLAQGSPPHEVIAELGIRQAEYAACFDRIRRVADQMEIAA